MRDGRGRRAGTAVPARASSTRQTSPPPASQRRCGDRRVGGDVHGVGRDPLPRHPGVERAPDARRRLVAGVGRVQRTAGRPRQRRGAGDDRAVGPARSVAATAVHGPSPTFRQTPLTRSMATTTRWPSTSRAATAITLLPPATTPSANGTNGRPGRLGHVHVGLVDPRAGAGVHRRGSLPVHPLSRETVAMSTGIVTWYDRRPLSVVLRMSSPWSASRMSPVCDRSRLGCPWNVTVSPSR